MALSCRKQAHVLMTIKESKSKGLQNPEDGNTMAKPSPGNDLKKPPTMPGSHSSHKTFQGLENLGEAYVDLGLGSKSNKMENAHDVSVGAAVDTTERSVGKTLDAKLQVYSANGFQQCKLYLKQENACEPTKNKGCTSKIDLNNNVASATPAMAKRKRSLYESAPCKRLKISAKDTSGLESEGNIKMSLGEVQDMVKQEAFALFKQFDTKFEELNERIKRVECSPKHEMLVTKLQNVPEASTSQPSLPQPQQSSTAGTLARSLGSSSSPSSATVRSAQVSLCQKTDGPDCILASSVPEVVRVASPCRKETSILGIPSARLSVLEKEVVCAQSSGNGPEENAGLNRQACVSDVEKMIDLTTDDNDDQLGNEVLFYIYSFAYESTGGLQPAAVNESSVSVARVNLTLRLPAKDPVSPSRTLPPLPETAVPLDLPAVAASFNMPQKPELKVAKIENPKAVGILWDLSQVDTSVASIQSYCLYVLHENANVRKLRWRSMGVIKAIQLPMCCRLTKLNPGRYHFAVVGKDIYGRYGPYSDIQSTTVSAVDC
ncbi:MCAF1 protein, partial [Polyodon spathula]|nr:MCAF1 protein [Polyodon spathula]